MDTKKDKNELSYNEKLKHVIEYGKLAYDMEQEREQNTYNQCGQLLTSISILLVALQGASFELYKMLPKYHILIVVFSIILTILLLTSMLLLLVARWPHKRKFLRNANELREYAVDSDEPYTSEMEFLNQTISDLSNIQASLDKNNKKRTNCTIASTILLYVFFGGLVLAGLTIFIVAIV